MLYTATNTHSPYSIRYPRGAGAGTEWRDREFETIPTGKGRRLKEGEDLAIVTIGTAGNFAAEAIGRVEAEGKVSVAHYDLRFAKPLDEELLREVGEKFDKVITVEDGALRGGVGEAVVKLLSDNGYKPTVRTLGIDDRFIEHGTPAQLYSLCGYDSDGIERAIYEMIKK
jgi:1-deoxy-D-xylulose-5-phosphate synthase